MSVKNFKFVSPGVFINEIDNSFLPSEPQIIGPVIVGRADKGLAMTPIKVENYRDFVDMFGDTVPGRGGGDVYRDGNNQSPMYGTYAAKAFLRSQVAPITYIRLLGQQSVNKDDTVASKAGWQTNGLPGNADDTGGGAYGLFVAKSSSFVRPADTPGNSIGTGDFALGAVIYADKGAMLLSGAILGTEEAGKVLTTTASLGAFIKSSANGDFTIRYLQGTHATPTTDEKFSISLDDSSQNFIRRKINTNPTLLTSGTFYPATADKNYWLGESYETFVRDTIGEPTDTLVGIMLPIGSGSSTNPTTGPMRMKGVPSTEAKAGWFISQDVGPTGSYRPDMQQKLFRLKGRGHGEWLHKNAKVQIAQLRGPVGLAGNYGSFSVIIRALGDTDANPQILERFDNLNLDPTSPNFISKVIGDMRVKYDETNRRLRRYGDYANQSKYVYVELNDDVAAGATNPSFIPFGYFGPPKYADVTLTGSADGVAGNTTLQADIGPVISAAKGSVIGGIEPLKKSATGTIKIKAATVTIDRSFTIVSSDGTSRDYQAKGTENTAANQFVNTGGVAAIAASLKNCIEATEGHAGKINVTLSTTDATNDTVNLVQVVGGTDGNRTITMDFPGADAEITGIAGGVNSIGALSGGFGPNGGITANLKFPFATLVAKDTDAAVTNRNNCVFGMRSTRKAVSTRPAAGLGDLHRILFADQSDDPSGLGLAVNIASKGNYNRMIDAYSYVFSMDDIVLASTSASYTSGSRVAGTSKTAQPGADYRSLLDEGYDTFMAPFFGGFDGFDITKPDPLANQFIGSDSATSYTYHTYRQALETIAEPELLDFDLLAVPGLTNESLTNYQMELCQERRDALAIIDLPNVYTPFTEQTSKSFDKDSRANVTPSTVVTALRARRIDNSYACTFYPWVQTRDGNTGQTLWVPPSVAMMGVLASSQRKTDVWFAPAGFNRGGLSDGAAGIPITNVSARLSSKERDQLYEAHINPIASFPSSGIVVFGQKTLQMQRSALDRINVRRLVIFLKKQISILSTQVLFEQNVQATWDRFKGLIEPLLANVKTRYGLTEYKLILDETTTTPDLIDQNILYAKIMVKPARAIEFIAIDFIIANTGASFDD